MESRIALIALCAAAAVAGPGCSTEFGTHDAGDGDEDTGVDAVDPGVDTAPDTAMDPIEDPAVDTAGDDGHAETVGSCGDGTIQGGEECEVGMTLGCTTECGLEGFVPCDPYSCTWTEPCRTHAETCGNGCDDDLDGMTDCDDIDCTTSTACICTDDPSEPNDSMAAAKLLTNGTHPGYTVCPGNDDFFRFGIVLPTTAVVQVLFSNAEGDIDLTLSDSSGTVISSSNSPDDDEQVTADLAALGQYYIRVYMYDDLGVTAGNSYSIVLSY